MKRIGEKPPGKTENPCVAGSIPALATIFKLAKSRSIAGPLDVLKQPERREEIIKAKD